MPLSVEKIGTDTYSFAHYYEQNGDLVADPEMVFKKIEGYWFPISFAMPGMGIYREAIIFNEAEKITAFRPNELADAISFTKIWLRNIFQQQKIA